MGIPTHSGTSTQLLVLVQYTLKMDVEETWVRMLPVGKRQTLFRFISTISKN